MGVPWDAPDDLFWNFEYLTSGSFGRLLSADFKKNKKCSGCQTLAVKNFGR